MYPQAEPAAVEPMEFHTYHPEDEEAEEDAASSYHRQSNKLSRYGSDRR